MDKPLAETWTINVGGRSYGPYSAAQMRSFATEGRLAPHSLVSSGSSGNFHPASKDAFLSSLFRSVAAQPEQMRASASPAASLHRRVEGPPERTQFVVIADMKSGSLAAL